MPSTQVKTFDNESIQFEIYSPKVSNPDILFVHHGSGRSTYSSGSEEVADEEGLAVFSPIFPESSYDSDEYQRGGIVDDSDRVLPEDQWTTRLEEPMIDWARSQVGGDANVYLFGHSAGGQYLSRVAAYERPEGVDRFVVANPSTWVLPSLTEDAPYGFDGLGTDAEERQALKEYLALPMTIYLGGEDDNPNDSDLATGAAAMRQGSTRLERGINTFEMGQEVAEDNGWDFNWSLVIADGVGHSGSSMLRAPEMIEALRTVDGPDNDGPDNDGPDDDVPDVDVPDIELPDTDVPANGAPYAIALRGSSVDETATAGTVVGRLSAKDPDGDTFTFSIMGDSRFAVKGAELVVAAGADLTGNGDRTVNLMVSARDSHGAVAKANVAVTIEDSIDDEGPSVDRGAADDFRFSGDIRRGTKVSRLDELSFDDGDTLSFFRYDRGTFKGDLGSRNGTRAEIDSMSELAALDCKSKAVSLSSNKDADLIIKIDQDDTMHKIVVHELTLDSLF